MADPATLAIVALIGLAGGVVAGLFGVGGGVVMVPLLLLALPETTFKEAKAASLLVIIASAAVATLAHRRRRSVDFGRGAILGASGVAGAVLAVLAAETLADRTLTIAFGLALVGIGVRFLFDVKPRPKALSAIESRSLTIAVGLAAGFLAGFFGIGGGVVMVPALVFLGAGMHLAVGTSLVAVAVNAVAATGTHLAAGYLPVLLALGLPLALGAVPGSEVGARLAHRLPAARLQRAFGAFVALVGAYLAARAVPLI